MTRIILIYKTLYTDTEQGYSWFGQKGKPNQTQKQFDEHN
jgi:hypothetical protein